MVGKTLEYVEAMDKMILSLPDVEHYRKEFVFYLSMEFAQCLLDYVYNIGYPSQILLNHGDEFLWKGFKCKVV